MIKGKLPIPFDGYKEATIKNVAPSVLSKVREEISSVNVNKYFYALLEFVLGVTSKLEDTIPSHNDIKKMPLRTAEAVALTGMGLTSIDDMLVVSSICKNCGHINKKEKTKRDDTRICVSDIEINFSEEENPICKIEPYTEKEAREKYKKLKIESDDHYENRIKELTTGLKVITTKVKNRDDIETFIVKSMSFRQPTLKDCIEASRKTNQSDHQYNSTLFRILLTDMEYEYDGMDDITDWKDALNKFLTDGIFDFTTEDYTDKIYRELFKFGINPFVEIICEECGNEYSQGWGFHSFFVYALLSNGQAKGKG